MNQFTIDIEGHNGVDTKMAISIPPGPGNVHPPPVSSTISIPQRKVRRPIVDSSHLTVLLSAYYTYFAEYSKKRKSTTQLVPALVWRDVYNSYKKSFPQSNFVEDTLKDRLRETLREMRELKTGTSNQENLDSVLQDDDLLTRIKAINGRASRNILKAQKDIVRGVSIGEKSGEKCSLEYLIPEETSPYVADSIEANFPLGTLPKARESGRANLKRSFHEQAVGISSIAEVMQSTQKSRDALIQGKIDRIKLSNWKTLFECNVITMEEFKKKAAEILGPM